MYRPETKTESEVNIFIMFYHNFTAYFLVTSLRHNLVSGIYIAVFILTLVVQ
jgi:hypothetical protein